MRQLAGLLLITLLLTACGFHLRGQQDMPGWLKTIAIINESGNEELNQPLKAQLAVYHVQVVEDARQAPYWLVIKNIDYSQQLTSVSASSNPRQFQMLYRVRFMLQTPKGEIVRPLATLATTRQLTMNNDRILGSDDEADLLLAEMRQDMVLKIISRLTKN